MAPKSRFGDGCSLNFDAKLVIATMPRSILQWGHTSGPSAVLREREIENPSMEWRLSGNALKMFAGAINCLASIGTKLAIHATPSQVICSVDHLPLCSVVSFSIRRVKSLFRLQLRLNVNELLVWIWRIFVEVVSLGFMNIANSKILGSQI